MLSFPYIKITLIVIVDRGGGTLICKNYLIKKCKNYIVKFIVFLITFKQWPFLPNILFLQKILLKGFLPDLFSYISPFGTQVPSLSLK